MSYRTVLARTGLTDTVGFTEAGYMEYFPPQPVIEITQEQHLVAVRAIRNDLLQRSDWTQQPDALSTEKRAEWAVYRQALRDVPLNINYTISSPLDVPMPQAPN
jgi:hypothetical protein